MGVIIIIGVNAFLQFICLCFSKTGKEFQNFYAKSCLTNNKLDVLFMVSLFWGHRLVSGLYNLHTVSSFPDSNLWELLISEVPDTVLLCLNCTSICY